MGRDPPLIIADRSGGDVPRYFLASVKKGPVIAVAIGVVLVLALLELQIREVRHGLLDPAGRVLLADGAALAGFPDAVIEQRQLDGPQTLEG
jgi:hypothetical protein